MFYTNPTKLLFSFIATLTALFLVSCSGTNKSLSPEGKVLSQKVLAISSFILSVNGEEVQSFDAADLDKEISGIDALIFGTKEYGMFVVSTEKFNKSDKVGTIDSEGINFNLLGLQVSVEPVSGTLTNLEKEAAIWVRQLHNRKSKTFAFDTRPYSTLNNGSYLETLPFPDFVKRIEFHKTSQENKSELFEQIPPQIVGGLASVQQKIRYPKKAIENNVSGYVRIKFKVSEDGKPYDFEFLNRLGSGCDQEALYAIKASEFIPGKADGYPAPASLLIPVRFKR